MLNNSQMVKSALITGITGMVGSHLLDYLVDNTDWEIHGVLRWRSPLNNITRHIKEIDNGKRIHLHYADITDFAALEAIFFKNKFDFIFHLAAQSYPATSFKGASSTYIANILGTENILANALKYSKNSIVHNCSSSEVFGRVNSKQIPIKEDTLFHPASPYAISKCGADLIGRYYAEAYCLNVQTTRMFTHTGPRRGDVFMESTFAKQIALIEADFIDPIISVGNLESVRTIADVRDAVRAYYLLVNSKDIAPGGYFNIGGSYTTTVKDILEKLINLSNRNDIEYKIDPSRIRPIDADLQIPCTEKFKSLTGWSPVYTFEETMADLLNYWRDQIRISGHSFLKR